MIEKLLHFFDINIINFFLLLVCAIFIGMSKTGISGASTITIPLMAHVYGGLISSGLVLPMLFIADIFGVSYYHKHASWKHVFKLLPWAAIGIFLGIYVGKVVDDEWFKKIIGIIVLTSMGILVYRDILRKKVVIPDYWWFPVVLGLCGGFATMIGNAAGPIMAFYLLSMHLPKNSYIGTGAWFFFIINLFKIPFHIFIWHSITLHSLMLNLLMIPGIFIGAWLGVVLVKLIPEKGYRIFIIITTVISSLLLFR